MRENLIKNLKSDSNDSHNGKNENLMIKMVNVMTKIRFYLLKFFRTSLLIYFILYEKVKLKHLKF